MYGLIRSWNRQPGAELSAFENRVARLFNDAFGTDWQATNTVGAWIPPVDIVEQKEVIRIVTELPGVHPDQVKISVEGNVLTIQGTKEQRTEEESDRVHRSERVYGSFERTFTLPASVDAGAIRARAEHGILTVTLPKVEKAKPRQIEVQVAKA